MNEDADVLYCYFHPERIALERCEVCNKPLCAYCLYYAEDGQRLCVEHAAEARALGLHVDEPAAYADQLIGAQVGADRKRKRGLRDAESTLYKGNSTDLTALIALVLGVVTLGSCCGGLYCVPVVGLLLALWGLLNARKAYDPSRTRKLSAIALAASGVVVLIIVGGLLLYGMMFATLFQSARYWPTWAVLTSTPTPSATPYGTPPPSVTPAAPPLRGR